MNQGATVESLSIVIPAKNEASSIGDLVSAAIDEFPTAEIIVVDDGSTDRTAEIAENAGAKATPDGQSFDRLRTIGFGG